MRDFIFNTLSKEAAIGAADLGRLAAANLAAEVVTLI